MPLSALEQLLRESFDPGPVTGIDAVFRLQVEREALTFRVRDGTLDFGVEACPDATFMFDHVETARALLSGEADAVEAFMHGRFRSDGYLLWAFVLLAMFRRTGPPVTG